MNVVAVPAVWLFTQPVEGSPQYSYQWTLLTPAPAGMLVSSEKVPKFVLVLTTFNCGPPSKSELTSYPREQM